MNKKRFQQTGMVEQETVDQYQERYEHKRQEVQRDAQRLQDSIRSLVVSGLIAVGAVVVLVAFMLGLLGNLHQYMETSSAAMKFLLNWFVPGLGAAAVLWCVVRLYRAFKAYRFDSIELKRAQAEIDDMNDARTRANKMTEADYAVRMAEAKRILAEADQIHRTINFDGMGNAGVINPETWEIAQFRGNYQQYPNLHTIRNDNKLEAGAQANVPALPEGNTNKPTFEECLRQVTPNSLQLCPGRNLDTGEYVLMDIPDTHFLLIGTTRKGKSTQAASLMDMAIKTHNPMQVQLALLDLEDMTCNLFAQEPHVLTLNRQGKRIKAIARSAQEVVQYLGYLVDLMDERYLLTPRERARLPHILIYIEEFIDLKRRMKDKNQREAMANDFGIIAERGLKANMHLMVCAQASYSVEDFREAMAQLTGTMFAFSAPPRLAQAAGFMNYELLKKNYLAKIAGQFVYEGTGETCLGAAPEYDLKGKLRALQDAEEARLSGGQTIVNEVQEQVREVQGYPHLIPLGSSSAPYQHPTSTPDALDSAPAWQARIDVVSQLLDEGKNQEQIIEKVWRIKKGGNPKYGAAREEYQNCLMVIKERRQQAFDQAAGE